MIYLMLDIDGVIHRCNARSDAQGADLKPFAYLPHLEAVLRDYPDVRVVIASDWQMHHTLDELRSFFAEDLRERIVGATGRQSGDFDPGNRQRDVERYLREQSLADVVWCALDDDEQNYLPGAALVHCKDGFREREECALRAAFDSKKLTTQIDANVRVLVEDEREVSLWFDTPIPQLGGLTPRALMEQSDALKRLHTYVVGWVESAVKARWREIESLLAKDELTSGELWTLKGLQQKNDRILIAAGKLTLEDVAFIKLDQVRSAKIAWPDNI